MSTTVSIQVKKMRGTTMKAKGTTTKQGTWKIPIFSLMISSLKINHWLLLFVESLILQLAGIILLVGSRVNSKEEENL